MVYAGLDVGCPLAPQLPKILPSLTWLLPSVSLLGPVSTGGGHVSALESQSGHFIQSSGSSLDWYPLLPKSPGF